MCHAMQIDLFAIMLELGMLFSFKRLLDESFYSLKIHIFLLKLYSIMILLQYHPSIFYLYHDVIFRSNQFENLFKISTSSL